MQKASKNISAISLLITIVVGIFALFISVINRRSEGQYIAFYIQLVSVFFLLVSAGTKLLAKLLNKKTFNPVNEIGICQIIIFVIAVMVSSAFLSTYPFVSLGDEVRDGGLTMQQFLSGQIANPLGYGRYDAHGLLLPEYLSPFSLVFPRNELAFRVPAALLAILSVGMLYLVGLKIAGKFAGLTAVLVLLTTPIHLFYARTEPIVIVGSLLVSTLLFLFTLDLKSKYGSFLGAYFIGFCMNFHASLRPVAIIALGLLIACQILNSKINLLKRLTRTILILLIFVVGFGPRIVYTPLSVFFHTSRLVGLSSCPTLSLNRTCISSYANYLLPRYVDSLKVWFFKPTSSWYPYHQPIYPRIYLPLFLLGLFTLYRRTNYTSFKWLVTTLLFTIPLTNSAVTDMVNADHRLLVIVPIGALIIGLGLEGLSLPEIKVITIKKILKLLKIATVIGLVIISTFRVGDFFINKRADKSNRIIDYLFMHSIRLIQKYSPPRGQTIAIKVSPENAIDLNYLHYQEQRQYFTPSINYKIIEDTTLAENQLVIDGGNQTTNLHISCETNFFYCPRSYTAGFVIEELR